jgi:hypothetical protein
VNTANQKLSMMLLDLPFGRPLPLPVTGNLEVGDLLQMVGKARHFGDGFEVEIPPAADVQPAVYIPTIRRRRR